jgi:hypothetical protein
MSFPRVSGQVFLTAAVCAAVWTGPAWAKPGPPRQTAVKATSKEWVVFVAPDKSFRVLVPAPPRQSEKDATQIWSSSTDPKTSLYIFGYTSVATPKPGKKRPPIDRKKQLAAVASYLLKQFKISGGPPKSLAERPGVEGMEVQGTSRGLPCEARFTPASNQRIYFLMTIGKANKERFFRSFQPGP